MSELLHEATRLRSADGKSRALCYRETTHSDMGACTNYCQIGSYVCQATPLADSHTLLGVMRLAVNIRSVLVTLH